MMMAGPGAFRDFTPLRLTPFGFQCDAIWDAAAVGAVFQESAAATPADDHGEVVGFLRDLSGNGRNGTQNSDTTRPTFGIDGSIKYISYDGVNDFLSVSVPKGASWFAGMAYRKAAAGGRGVLLGSTSNSTQTPIADSTGQRMVTFRGTGASASQQYQAGAASGGKTTWTVLSAYCDADTANGIRVNGTDLGALTSTGSLFTSQTTWNLLGGRVGSGYSAMDLARGFILPRVPSTEEMDILDNWLKAGVGL
jgi:hypothetical protein